MRRSDSRPSFSLRPSLPSLRDTPVASIVCSLRPATPGRGLRGVGVPVPEPEDSVEKDGSPKFLGTPRVPWPCSPTPAGSVTPGHCGVPAWSPRLTRARTPAMIFRGSIAWPWHSLSTLRREGRPSTTQDSLPAAGQLCRTGFVNPQGSDERFPSSRLFPLSQASWRNVASFPEMRAAAGHPRELQAAVYHRRGSRPAR